MVGPPNPRAIYEAVNPGEGWAPVGFKEAKKFGTVHYQNAVVTAQDGRMKLLSEQVRQMVLI